jgi:hypothetical protein
VQSNKKYFTNSDTNIRPASRGDPTQRDIEKLGPRDRRRVQIPTFSVSARW